MSEREREKMRTASVHEWEKEKCKIMIWLNREEKGEEAVGERVKKDIDSGRTEREKNKRQRQRNKTGGVLKFELLDHWLDRSVS